MKSIKVLLVLLALSAFAATAAADTLSLTGVNGNVNSSGQVYISPYYGQVVSPSNPQIPQSPTGINIYCVDPTHESYTNTTWNVDVTNLITGNLSHTLLGKACLVTYEEMAYLYFDTGYLGKTVTLATQQAIQAAVWYLASPGNQYGADNSWVTQAINNYQNFNYSYVYILTDINSLSSNQTTVLNAFMIQTPEPVSLVFMGTGLAGLAGNWLRRRRGGQKAA